MSDEEDENRRRNIEVYDREVLRTALNTVRLALEKKRLSEDPTAEMPGPYETDIFFIGRYLGFKLDDL